MNCISIGETGRAWTWLIAGVMLAGPGVVAPSAARGDVLTYWTQSYSTISFHIGDPNSSTRSGTISSGQVLFGLATSHYQAGDAGHYGVALGSPPVAHIIDSSAFADVTATATVGRLTAHMEGGMSLDFSGAVGPLPEATYNAFNAQGVSSFREIVTYTTTNPLGSDVKLELGLESTVSADGTLYPDILKDGSYGAFAGATLNITKDGTGPISLITTDSISRSFGEDTVREHIMYQATIIHFDSSAPLVLLLDGQLYAGAGGGNTTAVYAADASHTALFAVSSDDPLAHYTTASGAVFPTSVPEPSAVVSILACGTLALSRRRCWVAG